VSVISKMKECMSICLLKELTLWCTEANCRLLILLASECVVTLAAGS
jgi:hypothetical protein